PLGVDPKIVILDIDEKSLAVHGRWPWPRALLAELTKAVRGAGASFIVFDMVFSEPDATPDIAAGAAKDRVLANALAAGPSAAGFFLSFLSSLRRSEECSPPAVPIAFQSGTASELPDLFAATGVSCNIPAIAQSLTASGFLNAGPDSDGVLRRMPLLVRYGERTFPSLPLAVYLAMAPSDPVVLENGLLGDVLHVGRMGVPLDGRASMMVRFHGPAGAFPHYPAADVLSGAIARAWLDGKIVMIGSSAQGLREYSVTPVDSFHPGVDLEAAALDNLLHGDFLHRSMGGWFWEKVVAILLGLAATAIVCTGPGMWRLGVAGLQGVLLWFAVWTSLSRDGAYFSPVPASVTLASAIAVLGGDRLLQMKRRAEQAMMKLASARKFTLNALAAVMEVRDAETGAHLLRTQNYTRVLCRALSRHPRFRTFLTSNTIEMLVQLAPIHDIGKIGIPDRILRKPGPLTHEEYSFMRKHVEFGCDVIERASQRSGVNDEELLRLARDIIYAHHEHWNGNGYPRGLSGDQIPIAGRLLAVVDMYDALVSRRVYKES
ncbi:MAG: CHASE2 domain-containing protein, partial [Acidobacteriota bacterium]